MKKVIFFLSTALLFLSACGSVSPMRSMEASVNIRVECRDDPGTRQTVLGLLRQARARDVTETVEPGGIREIKASYYEDDNSPRRLEEIASLLQTSGGVFFVEMQQNQNLVKQMR